MIVTRYTEEDDRPSNCRSPLPEAASERSHCIARFSQRRSKMFYFIYDGRLSFVRSMAAVPRTPPPTFRQQFKEYGNDSAKSPPEVARRAFPVAMGLSGRSMGGVWNRGDRVPDAIFSGSENGVGDRASLRAIHRSLWPLPPT